MFVITADQVDSRHRHDIVEPTLQRLSDDHGDHLALAPDRNAGDEIQLLFRDADTAVAIVLQLTRSADWSVGLGIGSVEHPLPTETRAARGAAFIAARDAVTAAKRASTRFALRLANTHHGCTTTTADDVESLITAVLALRQRRTKAGWEVYDLLGTGITQREAAQQLGISEQAVAGRVSAANVKIDVDTHAALGRLCAALNSDADDLQAHPEENRS